MLLKEPVLVALLQHCLLPNILSVCNAYLASGLC